MLREIRFFESITFVLAYPTILNRNFTECEVILRIFCRILRTPTEDIWPGVTQLTDYKATFPNWVSNNLASQVKTLDEDGLDRSFASDACL